MTNPLNFLAAAGLLAACLSADSVSAFRSLHHGPSMAAPSAGRDGVAEAASPSFVRRRRPDDDPPAPPRMMSNYYNDIEDDDMR